MRLHAYRKAVAFLAVAFAIGACSPGRADHATLARRRRAPALNSYEGYPQEQTAEAAVGSPLNAIGLVGVVVARSGPFVPHLPDATLADAHLSPDDVVNNLVSTPVTMRVTEALFGPYQPGDLVTIRIIGGETAGLVTRSDRSQALGRLAKGGQLAVFGPEPTEFAGGVKMITPDQLFVGTSDHLVPAWSGLPVTSRATSVAVLRDLAEARRLKHTVSHDGPAGRVASPTD